MSDSPTYPPIPEWPEPAVCGLVDTTDGPIEFIPVPRLRRRRNGWTDDVQRAFIAALEQCGCIARAARAVGRSGRGVYRLLEAEGGESFAEAVDQAIARGVERVRGDAMLRALGGSWMPVVRKGKVVRMEFRYDDRLALGLLSGRDGRAMIDKREQASSRRRYRLQLNAIKAREAEEKRRQEAIWAEHQAIIDNPRRPEPRIRSL